MALKKKEATASAPATIANVGPGFEVFSLAIKGFEDTVSVRWSREPRVVVSGASSPSISRNPAENSAYISANWLRRRYGIKDHMTMRVRKGVPVGKGLGSSAASSVAGAIAFAKLISGECEISAVDFLEACARGEEAVAGYHFDNVSASALGGFIVLRSFRPLALLRIPLPRNLHIAVASPDIVLETRKMREILPGQVQMSDAISNVGKASTLVYALRQGEIKLLGECLDDRLAEPYRADFVTGYHQAKKAAIESGAFGFAIAGAGSSVFAVCDKPSVASNVAHNMVRAFESQGIEAEGFATTGNNLQPSRSVLGLLGDHFSISA